MKRILKTLHLVGLLLLTSGLIAAWILPDAGASEPGSASAAALAQSAYNALLQLALPGLMLLLITGVAQMLMLNLTPDRFRWVAVKLVLAGLMAGNLLVFQTPTARALLVSTARTAQGMDIATPLETLLARHGALALTGLGLILLILALSVIRPSLNRSPRPRPDTHQH
jgi:hypothetical protein